jgi:hypothetical protein
MICSDSFALLYEIFYSQDYIASSDMKFSK